jgi:hypothetical protein
MGIVSEAEHYANVIRQHNISAWSDGNRLFAHEVSRRQIAGRWTTVEKSVELKPEHNEVLGWLGY